MYFKHLKNKIYTQFHPVKERKKESWRKKASWDSMDSQFPANTICYKFLTSMKECSCSTTEKWVHIGSINDWALQIISEHILNQANK